MSANSIHVSWWHLPCSCFDRLAVSCIAVYALSGCGADSGGGEDATLPAEPFLQKPFDSEFLASNLFDHDLPLQFEDTNGYTVDHEGTRRNVGEPGAHLDSHSGYDWLLPEGTPLNAAAAGQVVMAGDGVPEPCPILPGSPSVSAKAVQILHARPNGDLYLSSYVHLSTVAVSEGDAVAAGQHVGTSGNTGCSGGPHLHFALYRWVAFDGADAQWVTVDPYGWQAAGPDPWSQHPAGATSVALWVSGQAPALVLQ